MKCEMSDRDQRIDDFLLEKLSPEDTEAFEIHLFGCSECLQELRLREQMVKLIKEERVTLVAAPVATRAPAQSVSWIRSLSDFFNLRPSGWIYVGAAAVLLVGFVITQIVRKTDHAEMYAANFIEPPQLESMLGQVQRSSAFAVSVLSHALRKLRG
jgi:anti-sigma factor RsiW